MDDRYRGLTLYEVNLRQYTPGGTFKEFEHHLPRLKELGAGILWLMPVQPTGMINRKGTLGSYYSIRDFRSVDPVYGGMKEFRELIDRIHSMNMFVILDWVANHTAWDHPWTKGHPEFYVKNEWGGFRSPNEEWTDVIQLDHFNFTQREAMMQEMEWWVKETGIDGFRCDMAGLLPLDFWNALRPRLEKIKPVFMLAEADDPALTETAFDVIYDWQFHHLLNDVAQGRKNAADLEDAIRRLVAGGEQRMLFTDNHDENSWKGSAAERLGPALEPLNALLFTLPGIPLIYSGQEAGSGKRLRFFEKDLIDWNPDKMESYYRKMTHLKKSFHSISHTPENDLVILQHNQAGSVLAFTRNSPRELLVIMNISGKPVEVILELPGSRDCLDYFSGKTVRIEPDTPVSLAPWCFRVLQSI